MALSTPSGYSANDLVFQEDFSGTTLNTAWHNYITSNAARGAPWNSNGSGGSGPGGQFDADYDMPSQVTVSNGTLNLTAIKAPVVGKNQGATQTFPITSGAVSSYGNFEFTGGYLQISMKAPAGDGAWPGLWLLPGKGAGSSGDNFEIDMQEGGYTGSGPANQAFSAHLHTPNGTFNKVIDTGVDLTAGFHTYAINWVPGQSITWYFDGRQMAQVTSAQMPIPTQPMELIMDNQVANSNTAGWHTVLGNSTPSSMQMQVDAIQLYQPAGSGYTVTGANISPSASVSPPAVTPPVTSPPVVAPPATPPAGSQDTASSGGGVDATNPPPASSSGGGTETGATTPPQVTSPPVMPSAYRPVLTVEDNSLSVNRNGAVDLGLGVYTSDPNDAVTVNIAGLSRNTTITNNLDDQVYRGDNVTLSAAQVESGLTFHSAYRGWGQPVTTLVATATATDPVTGAVATSGAQTVTVSSSAGAYGGTSTRHSDHSFSLLSQYLAGDGARGQTSNGQITTAASKASTWLSEQYFTRPQH
jgi:beta-glucanase (GH16 family)